MAGAGNTTHMARDSGNDRQGEAERYRQAATHALEMLDWCIGYLVGSHKGGIAARLARNRRDIKERLMRARRAGPYRQALTERSSDSVALLYAANPERPAATC